MQTEDLLIAGSTEAPDCRCGAEMHLSKIRPFDCDDVEIRIFVCDACHHEFQLMTWKSSEPQESASVRSAI
ncbi:MAG: hypothetical protein WCB49_02655 [Gammaproteobacteria bacterium]